MPIGWNLPPAASPVSCREIFGAIAGSVGERGALRRFKHSIREYFGVSHVFLVSTGTAALSLAMHALKHEYPQKDCVITPAYSCYSVLAAIQAAGLRPIFCDIDPHTLDLDHHALYRCLRSHAGQTIGILTAHLYGIPSNIARIRDIIGVNGPAIIEDAAQTMGASFSGTLAGVGGDIGVFSLGRGKAVSAVEGGIVITNNPDHAKSLQSLFSPLSDYSSRDKAVVIAKALFMKAFLPPSRYWVPMSFPFLRLGETIYEPLSMVKKMSGAQAGLMRDWSEKLSFLRSIRKKKAQEWIRHIPLAVTDNHTVDNIDLGALIRYPVFISDKNELQKILSFSRKTGLGLGPAYPMPLPSLPAVSRNKPRQRFSGAQTCCDHLLTLPNHQYVTRDTFSLVKHMLSRRRHDGHSTVGNIKTATND